MTLLIPILASFLGGIFALAGVLLTQRRQNELEQQRYTHALHDAKGQRIRAACAVLVAVADIRADAVRVLQLPERSALPEVPSEITAIFEASRVKSFIARGELALETEAREVADLDTQLFQRYVDFVDARRANFAAPDSKQREAMAAAERAIRDGAARIRLLAQALAAQYDVPSTKPHV